MQPPKTLFAKSGDLRIAYQTLGDGPIDLIYSAGMVWHLDLIWELPVATRFLRRLASFSRLILFNQRGVGVSDTPPRFGSLEDLVDDILAVLDAVQSDRAAMFATSDGCFPASVFAATQPARLTALALFGIGASGAGTDYPFQAHVDWARIRGEVQSFIEGEADTPTGRLLAPSTIGDERLTAWWNKFHRVRTTPARTADILDWIAKLDVRDVLGSIDVPTLVMRRTDDAMSSEQGVRDVAERIPGAKYVEVPGIDHIAWVGDTDAVVDEIEEFLTGMRHRPEPDRMLATVLFVDIVGSTQRAADLGDRRWRELLEQFYESVRRELDVYRGREVKTIGDAVLATFDGPARGIHCAESIIQSASELGLEVRAGMHTGECDIMGDDVGGIAVHIGARVSALAQPREVLVSSTVKDLVVGSGIAFGDRGVHALKGVPGEWRLFAVEN